MRPLTSEPPTSDRAFVDDGGILRFRDRWVALTDTQMPVVELLVSRLGAVVRTEDLLDAHRRGGGAGTTNVVGPLVHRLRRRLEPLGLTLHVVRKRGVLLEPTSPDQP